MVVAIDPAEGGIVTVSSEGMIVSAIFPPASNPTGFTASLSLGDADALVGGARTLGKTFVLKAWLKNGEPLTRFQRDYTLIVSYDASVLPSDRRWQLHHWRGDLRLWQPVQRVLQGDQMLVATLNEVSIFAVREGDQPSLYLPWITGR